MENPPRKSRVRPLSLVALIIGIVLAIMGAVVLNETEHASTAGIGGALTGLAEATGVLFVGAGAILGVLGLFTVRRGSSSRFPSYQRPPVTAGELPRAEARKERAAR